MDSQVVLDMLTSNLDTLSNNAAAHPRSRLIESFAVYARGPPVVLSQLALSR
jgi:hypothetical protein